MKKLAASLIALSLVLGAAAQGQPRGPKGPGEPGKMQHKEAVNRLESEHIAFLTNSLDLSPEEAQAFWPVYNKAKKEDRESYKAVQEKGKALREALKEQKSEDEIAKLLNEYQKAKADKKDVFAAYTNDFIKAVGVTKTAKFFISEENFRNKQIHNLGGRGPQQGHGQFKGQGQAKGQGQRPGPRPNGEKPEK